MVAISRTNGPTAAGPSVNGGLGSLTSTDHGSPADVGRTLVSVKSEVIFGSQLVDKNSSTPYTDATQVSRVDLIFTGEVARFQGRIKCVVCVKCWDFDQANRCLELNSRPLLRSSVEKNQENPEFVLRVN